ncbi:MAG: HDIG domain-containing protein [Candidatus Omnitrophica bacterium]|nr:HDIG domain-containing protein [Candidatus Omnitrophota bacterium]
MTFSRLKKPSRELINKALRLALGISLLSALFTIVYLSTGSSVMQLYEGDISLKDIYAPYDFTYAGDLDDEKMKEAEKEALGKTRSVYEIAPHIEEKANETISLFFDHLKTASKVKELVGDDEKIGRLKTISNLNLSHKTYRAFIKAQDIDHVKNTISAIVNKYFEMGILSDSDKDLLKEEDVREIIILNPSTAKEKRELVGDMPTLEGLKGSIERDIAAHFPKNGKLREPALEITNLIMSSNLQHSPEETQKRKKEAVEKLSKIYKKIAVKKNEILIGKGEKITSRHLKMLKHLGKTRELDGRLPYLVGMALLLTIFLIMSIFHLRFYESKIFRNNRDLLVISLLVLFVAVTAEVVTVSPLSSYFVPLASASMLIAILLDAHSAFIFTIIMSIFVGVVAGNNFGLMIVMFIGSSVGIYSVRKVRRRSKLLLAGFFVGAVNFLTIIALGLLNNLNPPIFLGEGGLGALNGLMSFLLVIGILPIFEYLFKIPTDITLLELSDLNHPLLKEMATKAPGTYHHSIIVGNLAEAACDAIGANSLLARVGAYYHDIGKIEKAEYFSENEGEPKNSRHGGITPSMSALVITNHVKDGIELARRFKLNQALIDFIAQHHGNGLIYYFYQRALEKVNNEDEISEEAFRYPGPRPQSKETAIVLLSDSVEASSRTLNNPTPSRVQGLVQRIINNKFIDGQLDECNLTLKDLHKISEAFMRVLNAMFHTRVEYPDEEKIQKSKNRNNNHKKLNQKTNSQQRIDSGDGKKSP